MSFFEELKRRNVVRVGIAYGVGCWLLIQVADILLERNLPAYLTEGKTWDQWQD